VVNVAADPDGLADYATGKGRVDVVLECVGQPARHRAGDLDHAAAGQRGADRCGGCDTLPLNLIVGKELRLLGTHRFDSEFAEAVRMIGAKEIDLAPMVTQVLPASDAVHAFDLAGDRAHAVKVQLAFAA
jgi:L-idonate 5-dehydrogenase